MGVVRTVFTWIGFGVIVVVAAPLAVVGFLCWLLIQPSAAMAFWRERAPVGWSGTDAK